MSDTDLHTQTAAKIFGIPASEVTVEQRAQAKAINFAEHYGPRGTAKYEVTIAKVHEHLYPRHIHGLKGFTYDDKLKVTSHMVVSYGVDDLWVDPEHIETLTLC